MTTGYVYEPVFLEHTHLNHPESAQRLHAILAVLQKADFWNDLRQVAGRAATQEEVLAVHHTDHVAKIEEFCAEGGGYLNPDTYVAPKSYQAAMIAAGGLIDLTLAVVDGNLDNGFALVRPPGHHATPNRAMGFCLFNNIAIAAKAVQQQRNLERIAIVDFDVHHGNGTQIIFDDDPTILFCSSHQYPFYPGTGGVREIGREAARGTKVNCPLMRDAGDGNIKKIYSEVVFPLVRRFEPQLILVSAGYDSHWNDPLAQLNLSLPGLAWISEQLVQLSRGLCDGKIVFTLEGGYDLEVLSTGVSNTFKALLGRNDFADPIGLSHWPELDVAHCLEALKRIHHLE